MAVGLLALVEPLLVEAAKRVLIILGGAAAGGVAVEETKKRREEAEETKDEPISKAETKTGRCCEKCPPDEGNTWKRKVKDVNDDWVQYQAKITGMAVGPDYIEEWKYKGKEFDGFKSNLCLLQEAKGNYDQFFKSKGDFKYLFQKDMFSKMLDTATKQMSVVRTSAPASLTYYFQTPLAYDYMKDKLTMLGIMVVLAP